MRCPRPLGGAPPARPRGRVAHVWRLRVPRAVGGKEGVGGRWHSMHVPQARSGKLGSGWCAARRVWAERTLGAAAQRSHSRVRPPRATRALHLRRGVEEAAKGTHGREALRAHSAWSTEARGEASELSRARSAPAPALPPPCEFVRFRFQTVQNFTNKGSIKGSNFTCTLTTEERLASSRQNAPSRVAPPRPMGTYGASELPPPHPSVPPPRASPCRSSAARGGRNVPACVSGCAQKPPVRRSRGPASPPSNAPRCPERRVPSAEFGVGWLRVLNIGFIHLEGMRNSF